MTNIIVPIDFTAGSRNAFFYAHDMAQHGGWDVEVVHIYAVDLGTMDIPPIMLDPKEIEERMRNFIESSFAPEVVAMGLVSLKNVHYTAIGGYIDQELNVLSAKPTTKCMVMAQSESGAFMRFIAGSITLDVAADARCPIIVVPEEEKFDGFRNILFAADSHSVKTTFLRRLKGLANEYKSKVHVVHIAQSMVDMNDTDIEAQVLQKLFADNAPTFSFDYMELNNTSVEKGLQSYIDQNNIDLLVLSTKHRGFWENLTHHSVTSQMLLTCDIPIMVLHDTDKHPTADALV